MQKSFWWWQCNVRYIISVSPHLHTLSPFSLSLISLMVTISTMFTSCYSSEDLHEVEKKRGGKKKQRKENKLKYIFKKEKEKNRRKKRGKDKKDKTKTKKQQQRIPFLCHKWRRKNKLCQLHQLFNADLFQKRYRRGTRSQEVGDEGDYTYHYMNKIPGGRGWRGLYLSLHCQQQNDFCV